MASHSQYKEVELRYRRTNFNWRVEAGNEMRSASLLTLAWLWAELTSGTIESQQWKGCRQKTQRPRMETVRRDTKRHKREMSRQNRKPVRETDEAS